MSVIEKSTAILEAREFIQSLLVRSRKFAEAGDLVNSKLLLDAGAAINDQIIADNGQSLLQNNPIKKQNAMSKKLDYQSFPKLHNPMEVRELRTAFNGLCQLKKEAREKSDNYLTSILVQMKSVIYNRQNYDKLPDDFDFEGYEKLVGELISFGNGDTYNRIEKIHLMYCEDTYSSGFDYVLFTQYLNRDSQIAITNLHFVATAVNDYLNESFQILFSRMESEGNYPDCAVLQAMASEVLESKRA